MPTDDREAAPLIKATTGSSIQYNAIYARSTAKRMDEVQRAALFSGTTTADLPLTPSSIDEGPSERGSEHWNQRDARRTTYINSLCFWASIK